MLKTKFFANCDKFDFFNINNQRIPLEKFLEFYLKPEGWVLSLRQKHLSAPQGLKIIDCGAPSYMHMDVPEIRGKRVTAAWAAEEMESLVSPGDIGVAPDTIIFPGVDVESRQKFNRKNAKEFLGLAREIGVKPMAVCHGLNNIDRIIHAQWLYRIGYRLIGIGGLKPHASNFKYCVSAVAEVRKWLPPDVEIHVLGLSSPKYLQTWTNLNVFSCDGSSYAQYAIRKGAFSIADGSSLKHYPIVSPGIDPVGPSCECPVCDRLRQEGFDPRISGSRQSSLGRIAHNLGQQIAAQRNAVSRRSVTLISCVEQKLDQRAPAKDLYNSQWWKAARKYAELNEHNWYALSARHGVVHPETELDPYDETLKGKPIGHRRQWAEKVSDQLGAIADPGAEIKFYTGRLYREFVVPKLLTMPERLWTAQTPLAGLQGIGYQLQYFKTFTPALPRLSLGDQEVISPIMR